MQVEYTPVRRRSKIIAKEIKVIGVMSVFTVTGTVFSYSPAVYGFLTLDAAVSSVLSRLLRFGLPHLAHCYSAACSPARALYARMGAADEVWDNFVEPGALPPPSPAVDAAASGVRALDADVCVCKGVRFNI